MILLEEISRGVTDRIQLNIYSFILFHSSMRTWLIKYSISCKQTFERPVICLVITSVKQLMGVKKIYTTGVHLRVEI